MINLTVRRRSSAVFIACHSPQASQDVTLEPGDLFLVVDAGGGTVDLTAHLVERRGGGGSDAGETVLAEASTCIGVFCGSGGIDAAFEAHVRDLVKILQLLDTIT